MKKDLIELAYEIAKKKYKKGKFKYRDLLAELIKTDSQYKNSGGDLYVEIISDIRFLSLGNDEWSLQEFYKYDEFEKISSAMFGLEKELAEPEIEDEVKKPITDNDEDGEVVIEENLKEEIHKNDDSDYVDEIIDIKDEGLNHDIEIDDLDEKNKIDEEE